MAVGVWKCVSCHAHDKQNARGGLKGARKEKQGYAQKQGSGTGRAVALKNREPRRGFVRVRIASTSLDDDDDD